MNTPTVSGSRPAFADIITLQAHILQQQARYPQATGTFSWILSAISICAKMIASQVRRARLEDVLGSAGEHNVQGEQQQKLDVIANDILLRMLGGREGVAIVASEENEEPVILRTQNDGETRYCVLFDPLDGSSNLDICGSVGTIFSILRKDRRYVGAMVGDVHRILLQGGVFMYPPTKKAPQGKLRLMYEANPMAMLVEQAGGKALVAPGQRILEVQPEGIHQRCCVVLGSSAEVDAVMAQVQG